MPVQDGGVGVNEPGLPPGPEKTSWESRTPCCAQSHLCHPPGRALLPSAPSLPSCWWVTTWPCARLTPAQHCLGSPAPSCLTCVLSGWDTAVVTYVTAASAGVGGCIPEQAATLMSAGEVGLFPDRSATCVSGTRGRSCLPLSLCV